ncbi:MAG: hypothetical protein HY735_38700 [Verrucomicrobia bacterium]|nr:hypothetical protein [Verrucomicrobiota bacterium]
MIAAHRKLCLMVLCACGVALGCSSCAFPRHVGDNRNVARGTVEAQNRSVQSHEIARIEARFEDERIDSILLAQFWTLAHCATEEGKKEVRAAIRVPVISEWLIEHHDKLTICPCTRF